MQKTFSLNAFMKSSEHNKYAVKQNDKKSRQTYIETNMI